MQVKLLFSQADQQWVIELVESDVVYIVVNGRGTMEVIEYMNSMNGHGQDPSQGIEHQDSYALTPGRRHSCAIR